MQNRIRAGVGAALLCALYIGVSACGGGGGGGSSGTATGAAAPTTPTTPSGGGGGSGSPQPALFIDHDPDGTAYLRVQEQTYNPFGADGPGRVVHDQNVGPSPGVNFIITGDVTTQVNNITAHGMKIGMDLMASATTSIYNYNFNDVDGGGDIYGAGVKLGANTRPTTGVTYLQRAFADGGEAPDPTYTISNTDFIGIERGSAAFYGRDITGRRFGDAGIDSKSTNVYVMNGTFQGGHRMIRAWSGVTITLANSIVNASPSQMQVWVQDATSNVRYYNTLWCLNSAAPSASDPNCKWSPWLIESDGMGSAEAVGHVTALNSNPLPGMNPFFRTQMDQIVVEYSANGGAWQTLALPNTGGGQRPPVGDTRYRIPLNLGAADYRFRARYLLRGNAVGSTSKAINEAGAIVQ